MKNRNDIIFNDYELIAINIIVLNEIHNLKEQIKNNDFRDKNENVSAKNYLDTLIKIDNKINKRDKKESD